MPDVHLHVTPSAALEPGFEAIRRELHIDDEFPADVEADARAASQRGPVLPPGTTALAVDDRRDVPFVTIDPPGSRDLDQAVSLARTSSGFTVRYAIADVAAFVTPGGAIDTEARRRAVTVYFPDKRVPLHPFVLSEGATSLLPGQDRQALVWDIELDGDGEPTSVRVARAMVRSRAQLTYDGVQASLDDGSADDQLHLLRSIGRLREAREADRGGVSLQIPEQHVADHDGHYDLEYRAPLPAEGWNAQISLLAGMCAAKLMVDGGIGVLRTLPPPSADTVETLRRRAAALGVAWPDDRSYADAIRRLDPKVPAQAALIIQSARLFRGAGYVAFEQGAPAGDDARHAAVAAPYAHVTAPLRRLVDRFGNEVVLSLCAAAPVPEWAASALEALPDLMADGTHRAGAANNASLDLVEAAVLAGRVGADLPAVVTNVSHAGAQVQIRDPAVVAMVPDKALALGQEVCVRVVSADPLSRRVELGIA